MKRVDITNLIIISFYLLEVFLLEKPKITTHRTENTTMTLYIKDFISISTEVKLHMLTYISYGSLINMIVKKEHFLTYKDGEIEVYLTKILERI